MDKHLHQRTDCPVCLRIPEWQIDIFTSREDLCNLHYYLVADKHDDEFAEYHDGQEVAESWGWEIDWEIDREEELDLDRRHRRAYLEELYYEQLEFEQNYSHLYLSDCLWCGSTMHDSPDCPDKWLIHHSPFDGCDI